MRSEGDQTTISISRKNHQALSKLGAKGQSFDDVISEILRISTDSQQKNIDVQQPRSRVNPSQALAAELSSAQIALESNSDHV